MNPRAELLSLFSGQKPSSFPAFSGLIHITQEGLQSEDCIFQEVHHDARKMANAAASTFKLTGIPSAALPLDLCAPAEALGTTLKFYEGNEHRFPQPAKSLFASTSYLNTAYFQSAKFINKGRLPMICDAIRLLREDIGNDILISGIIPGPYTLLLYLIEPGGLFAEMKREPHLVQDALSQLSSFLSQLGSAYRLAGADFITIHEMGGSPGFIGPPKFEQFVFPALKQLMAELAEPKVLSICGNANKSLSLLNETGADAVSVDQLTDLKAARESLKDTLLFGNLDPVAALWLGNADSITEAVRVAKESGVDAVWPGCDLVPQTSVLNLNAWKLAAQSL